MCFSAEASFGTGTVIAIIGGITLQKTSTPSQRIFASIPLFFAIQQAMEGILWISLPSTDYLLWQRIATYGFLLFAWIVWPVLIPFSIWLLEKDAKRRRLLAIAMGMGTFVSLFFAYILIFHHAQASIEGYHIVYHQDFEYSKPFLWLTSAFYFIPTALSHFISSNKKVWLLGITILFSFIITKIYFEDHLVSIWCFFAALLSVLILWVILDLRKSVLTEHKLVQLLLKT
ncbi:DUF6629 family protein [Catalinimonas niigatensis]|uniref:DUF6629 family protein n=1 Tax=Catalinimonas niigatensis TaxID=1397264 RepID=UPI002666A2C9|nr:DUF6629 family protein [Catalinimonas niigatensis]WPP49829.1 DUF6629 family protein [Catalinimonas niigatensis]